MLDVMVVQINAAVLKHVLDAVSPADTTVDLEDGSSLTATELRNCSAKLLQVLGLLSESAATTTTAAAGAGVAGGGDDGKVGAMPADAVVLEPTEKDSEEPGELEYLNDNMAMATAALPEAEPPRSLTAQLWCFFHA